MKYYKDDTRQFPIVGDSVIDGIMKWAVFNETFVSVIGLVLLATTQLIATIYIYQWFAFTTSGAESNFVLIALLSNLVVFFLTFINIQRLPFLNKLLSKENYYPRNGAWYRTAVNFTYYQMMYNITFKLNTIDYDTSF